MTTPAVGTASIRPTTPINISIPSSLTTSIQNLNSLSAAQLVAPAPPETPSVVIIGDTTSIPDSPGFPIIPPKHLESQAQMDAIRSAARNTAAAYGLSETLSADTASIEQLTIQQQIIRAQPFATITQVIIPD
jgi:hypothetical protein